MHADVKHVSVPDPRSLIGILVVFAVDVTVYP